MHQGILSFAKKHRGYFSGSILDVGSYDVNGSLRSVLPVTLGVDMREGPGVDRAVNASDLLETFGPESFDCVVSADALEHIEDWHAALTNMWGVLKTGGPMLLTMANPQKGVHSYPHDYWRWPMDRFKALFGRNVICAEFVRGPSQGVIVHKREPMDLSHQPDKVR